MDEELKKTEIGKWKPETRLRGVKKREKKIELE